MQAMSRYFNICLLLLPIFYFSACSLEKEVDLKLPKYDRELVVECFLEPGQPMRLLLFESIGFTEAIDTSSLPFISNALVVISHNGIADTLTNAFNFDPVAAKFYNYIAPRTVPFDYNSEFSLYIKDEQGREIRGTTQILAPRPFKDLRAVFDEDSAASIYASWEDDAGSSDFYLFTIHRDRLLEDMVDSTDDGLQFEFTLDDRVGNGEDFRLQTFYAWEKGELAIATVYHIDEGYWRYLETSDEAASSNGNPFGQPGRVISTVEGGIGYFTGLSYSRDTVMVQ